MTVHGRIDPATGMVTDIIALDQLVQDRVLTPFEGHDLRSALATPAVTGEYIAKAIWDRIATAIPTAALQRIKLVQTRDLSFEYAG